MRTKLVIAAVVTAGAVSAVGASAYTASITGGTATKVIGYTTTAINGAAMSTPPVLHYSTGLDQIDSIDVVLTGDTHTSTLSVNRNLAAPVTCTTGSYDSGTDTTPYTCSSLAFLIAGMTTIGYALQ
jgi:hypothetical protein